MDAFLDTFLSLDYIMLAAPFFVLFIFLEYLLLRRKHGKAYRFQDTLANINCGLLEQTSGLVIGIFVAFVYVSVYENFALLNLNEWTGYKKFAAIGFAFILWDFLYYWFHRVAHHTNIGWASHVVHHQSEEFNLSVALRQSSFQKLFSMWFILPMAVIGVPLLWVFVVGSINLVYQFFIHTNLVNKLGPLELIMNTPSHHRVHHAVNSQYIDKNHGGVFIVWDRMFGSFAPEKETPRYGVVSPLKSWNPFWANFKYLLDLIEMTKSYPRIGDKIKTFLKPPGWKPGGRLNIPPDAELISRPKYDSRTSRFLSLYAGVQFVLSTAIVLLFMAGASKEVFTIKGIFLFLAAWGLVNIGGLGDNQRWAKPAEICRLIIFIVFGLAYLFSFDQDTWIVALVGFYCLLALLSLILIMGKKPINLRPVTPYK